MKFKETLLLSLAFIGIVLYYFLLEVPAGQKAKETKELSEKILAFHTEDVDELSIVRKDQTVVVQRTGSNPWQIAHPLKTTADQFAIETFLDKLRDTRFSRIVEEEPADLSVYGLKDPALKVLLKIKNQGEMALSVGDKSPIGQSLYIKRDDQKKVLLTQEKDWGPSLFDLRNKTVLTHNTRDATDIELERHGALLRFTQKEGNWSITGNVSAKGDAKEIEDLLNSARASRISAFIEENPSDLGVFGLNPPSIRLTIQSGEQNTAQTLLIGAQYNAGKFYAKTGNANNVFALDSTFVATLSKGELEFLDKTLLEFKEEDIAELYLHNHGENIHVLRDKTDQKLWRMEEPVKSKGDDTAINNLLTDLKETKVNAYLRAADPKNYGLNSPQKRLTLITKENKALGFKIGEQINDKKTYYGAREGEPAVFTLSAETVDKIFRSLHDLRNRKLLTFKMDDVAKITIQYPDKTFELKGAGEDWSLLQPEQIKKIKPFISKDILWTLNNLEFDEIEGSAETGINQPAAKITIADRQNKILGTLLVGKQAGAQYYAQIEGNSALYRIKERFLSELPNDLKKFTM